VRSLYSAAAILGDRARPTTGALDGFRTRPAGIDEKFAAALSAAHGLLTLRKLTEATAQSAAKKTDRVPAAPLEQNTRGLGTEATAAKSRSRKTRFRVNSNAAAREPDEEGIGAGAKAKTAGSSHIPETKTIALHP
jgi:hypothetical protein